MTHESMATTFYFTKAGLVVQATTGSLSFASSIMIIFIIMRSESKLETVYHRIMFFMSFWDAIASAAMALTTIPMPVDVIYPFEGQAYGNVTTCEIQGFLYFTGMLFAASSISTLAIYYLCTIRYNMREETAKKILLPICFVYASIMSLPLPIVLFRHGMLNPQPHDLSCSYGKYPSDCSGEDCIRGNVTLYLVIRKIFMCKLSIGLFVIAVLMTLVVLGVYSKKKSERSSDNAGDADPSCEHDGAVIKSSPRSSQEQGENSNCCSFSIDETTRIVFKQATLYIGAFWLSWMFTLISFFAETNIYIQILKCVFQPSQGTFNAMIFIYHKIYLLQEAHNETEKELTRFEALKMVFLSPDKVPEILISDIEKVKEIDEFGNEGNYDINMPMPREQLAQLDLLPDPDNSSLDDLSISVDTPSIGYSNAVSIDISSTGITYADGAQKSSNVDSPHYDRSALNFVSNVA